MIRAETAKAARRPAINPLRGDFEATLAGVRRRFDTRLSTVAAIEEACGGRPVIEVLNGIILGRRARDQIPLLAAALGAADPPCQEEPETTAGRATVAEAEAFVLALIFALGFTVGRGEAGEGGGDPLDGRRAGETGAPSPSAA